jgi:hypothetical protein
MECKCRAGRYDSRWLLALVTMNAPEGHEFIGTATLIALPVVWPIYSIYSHRKRTVCARRYNQQVIDVRVKHIIYAEKLRRLNGG